MLPSGLNGLWGDLEQGIDVSLAPPESHLGDGRLIEAAFHVSEAADHVHGDLFHGEHSASGVAGGYAVFGKLFFVLL